MAAVRELYGEVGGLPAVVLVPEAQAGDLLAVGPLQLLHKGAEDGWGWHAVTHQIHGGELGVIPAQIAPQAVHLAGKAREEHGRSLLQKVLDLAEGVTQIALGVFGAPHGGQFRLGAGGGMAHDAALLQHGPEDHAAPLEGVPGQDGEEAAGGALCRTASSLHQTAWTGSG